MAATDVHQHLWPEAFVAALSRRREPPCLRTGELVLGEGAFPYDPATDDLGARLAALDRAEIDRAVLSLQPTLGVEALPDEGEREELVAAWVDGTRELLAAAPARLLAFAPGRVLDGFAGTSLGAGELRDRDALAPLLDGLEARAGVLFVHPGPSLPPPGAPRWWSGLVDYTAQMQAAYLSWIEGGRSRWPSVRGVDVRSTLDPNVFLDVATYGRRAIELCAETFGVDQLTYGSDAPVVDPAPTLHAVRGFGESVHRMLTDLNVQRLLG
jgi:hypothetical protein